MAAERSEAVASWKDTLRHWTSAERLRQHEDKVLLLLTLIIGAVVGVVVVGFIVVTENLGARMYPAGAAAWRRLSIPLLGALLSGYLLWKYFPNARGSGILPCIRRASSSSRSCSASLGGRMQQGNARGG